MKKPRKVKNETHEKGKKSKSLRGSPGKKQEFLPFNAKKIKKLVLITLEI